MWKKFSKRKKKNNNIEKLQKELYSKGNKFIYNKLKDIDPDYAKKIHMNNKKKIIRAIEVFLNSGKTMTETIKLNNNVKPIFEPLKIGLNYKDREKLYKKINMRVDEMLKRGLVEEAKNIISRKYSKTAMQAIGYKELIPYFFGNISLQEAVLQIKQNTRRYAKRQICWFKRDININWFYLDEKNYDEIIKDIFYLVQNFYR